MTNESNNQKRDIFDPAEILRLLIGNKWKLIIVTVVVGFITAVITLILPETYESSASLILREPKVPITGEASPLEIEMLQSLTDSTKIKMDVFNQMQHLGVLRDVPYRSFEKTLRTAVDKKIGRDLALLPMIRLSVRARKPELAAKIANAWVNEVTSASATIYSGDIESVTTFTKGMYDKVNSDLLASEEAYTLHLLQSSPTLAENRLTAQHAAYSDIFSECVRLDNDIATSTALLTETVARLNRQELNGVWVGNVYADSLRNNRPQDIPKNTTTTLQIVQLLREIDQNQKKLDDYEQASEVQYNEMLLKNKDKQLEQITQEIVKSEDQLAKSETQYKALQGELHEIPQKLTLNKAITDDALWQAYLNGKLSANAFKPLKSEESNPVYESIKPGVVQLSGEIQGQKSRVKYFAGKTETLRDEVSKLAKNLSHLTSVKTDLKDSIDKDHDIFIFFRAEYNKTREQRKSLDWNITMGKQQLEAMKAKASRLQEDIQKAEETYFKNNDALTRLARDVENRKGVRTSLAQKAEEMTLLSISAKQESRSGVAVLYPAEANPVRVSPKRTSSVLGSMAVAFVLFSMVLVMKRVIYEPM